MNAPNGNPPVPNSITMTDEHGNKVVKRLVAPPPRMVTGTSLLAASHEQGSRYYRSDDIVGWTYDGVAHTPPR